MTNRENFESIVRRYIKRDGIESLLSSLAKSDFYTAPASTVHHNAFEGGLVEHSLNVFSEMMMHHNVGQAISRIDQSEAESIAIIALFHDVCKVGYYKVEMRNTKDENGKWIQVPFYKVDDKFPFGHGDKSVFMIQEHMKLTLNEAMAIRWHMGLSVPKEEYSSMSKAFAEFPLALEAHLADMRATYLRDKR